ETDQSVCRDVGRQGYGELVPPLPGVHREEVVLAGVEVEGSQYGRERCQRVGVEFRRDQSVVVQCGRRAERTVLAACGQPDEPEGRARLRRVPAVLGGVATQPTAVGDETRVAVRQRGLDLLERGARKFLRRRLPPLEAVRGRGQGAAELLQIHRQDLTTQRECVAELQHEREQIEFRLHTTGDSPDAGRVDLPVVQGLP